MELVACPHCQAHNDPALANAQGHLTCRQCAQLMSVAVPPPIPTASKAASTFRHEDRDDWRSPSRRGTAKGFVCPFCGSTRRPTRTEQISTGGWITFAVLLAFCWPLFWIGLLIKETKNQCGDCGVKLD